MITFKNPNRKRKKRIKGLEKKDQASIVKAMNIISNENVESSYSLQEGPVGAGSVHEGCASASSKRKITSGGRTENRIKKKDE